MSATLFYSFNFWIKTAISCIRILTSMCFWIFLIQSREFEAFRFGGS